MHGWLLNDFEFQLGNALFDEVISEATDPLEKYATQLKTLSLKLTTTPEELLKIVIAADPTNKEDRAGDYIGWILKQMKFQNIRLPEDAQRIRRALMRFHELKRTGAQLEKDINKYTRFNDLEDALEALSGKNRNVQKYVPLKKRG